MHCNRIQGIYQQDLLLQQIPPSMGEGGTGGVSSPFAPFPSGTSNRPVLHHFQAASTPETGELIILQAGKVRTPPGIQG